MIALLRWLRRPSATHEANAATLERIAEEMRTYAKRWDDAEELERIAQEYRKLAKKEGK